MPVPVPVSESASDPVNDIDPVAAAAPPVWPRNLPPHLRPVRLLGAGGSARVWLARDRRSGRHVAVKVVELAAGPLGTTGVSLRRVRFEREARSLARLGGRPGVPCVVALGVDLDGVAWMVNEFVVGPTLADRVLGGDPLDADEAVAVLVGAAEALATAHEHGVVHGDVSPANVVLGSTGPVLVDFGVGGLDGDGGDAAITPLVASPQRLAGAGPSTADDTHALAATIRWSLCPRAVLPVSVEARLDACVAPSAAERPTAAALAVALGGRGTPRSGWGRRASRR